MDAGSSSSFELPQQFCHFTISEIHLATHNFDESLVIGHGGFGKVYKGTITNGATQLVAAIKRLDPTSNQGAEEFWNEVQTLCKLRHCHLVSLIGYCNDGNEMILVYEYMPHGTLEDHLHKFRLHLTWVLRLKICIGVARGLDYLHTGTGIKHGIIHRDIKSSNILLDDSWAAKISDFGLSKLSPINQPLTYVNTLVRGTFGYFDPDYYATGRLTRKSDVYAFGVVLLEVLTGKQAVDRSLDEEHWGLINWAQESIKEGRLKQIVDYTITERILPKCLKEFARLADRCLHSNPKKRPTMAEAVACLEHVVALQEKATGMTYGRNRLTSLELYFNSIGGEIRILRRFEFGTIKTATENFSYDNRIARHSLGPSMYKGRLQNGQEILVARHESDFPWKEYKNEVSLLVKLEHENLLQLLGYSIEGTQVSLVYEFAVSASLEGLIYDRGNTLLDWNKRNKIILAVARVLVYLHQHDVIHGHVTPQNILLDNSLDPKLSDIWPISREEDQTYRTWVYSYIAPEAHQANPLTTKADVYSFGVLILDAVSRANIYEYIHVPDIWTNWFEGKCSEIIDPRIDVDPSTITRFIQIGLLCVQEEPADRPTMEEVVAMLTNTSSLTLPIPYVDHYDGDSEGGSEGGLKQSVLWFQKRNKEKKKRKKKIISTDGSISSLTLPTPKLISTNGSMAAKYGSDNVYVGHYDGGSEGGGKQSGLRFQKRKKEKKKRKKKTISTDGSMEAGYGSDGGQKQSWLQLQKEKKGKKETKQSMLPTKDNPARRGVPIQSSLCLLGTCSPESADRLFLQSSTAKELLAALGNRWAKLRTLSLCSSVGHLFKDRADPSWPALECIKYNVPIRAWLWNLWCHRNDMCFRRKIKTILVLASILVLAYEVICNSSLWFSVKGKNKISLNWELWL